MSKLTKFDNHVYNDTAIIALVATPAAWIASGGGWLAGIALGVPMIVGALVVTAVMSEFVAKPPSALRMVFVWAPAAAIAYATALEMGTGQLFAQLFAAAIFAYGWGRSVVALRRMRRDGVDPESLHDTEPKPAELPAATPAVLPAAAVLPPVPEDLPEEIKALVAAAQQDFRDLCDALADPALAGAAGVDVAGMRGEADLLLRDILRRAPLVARVRRIAGERSDDAPARKTSDDALAALRRQADALRGATSAALQVAATAGHDPTLLREHTDNLHLLREIRDDARAVD
jgi:hypothetical protein